MANSNPFRNILNSNAKTNLHPIFCLKIIYIDGKRSYDKTFTSDEISSNWIKISQFNPSFFDSEYSETYILRLLRKKLIVQNKNGYLINKKFIHEFQNYDWEKEFNKRKNQKPKLLLFYNELKKKKSKTSFIDYCKENILLKDKNLSPSILEIFSYSVIKSHLWFFGADQNLHRYTKTNANDGGVDIACGDLIYCVTTNLNIRKIKKDAEKQVKRRLTFITIIDKVSRNEQKFKLLNDISKIQKVKINIIDLEKIINLANNFNIEQKLKLNEIFFLELENELKGHV